jgi:hypothetical protein
MRTLLESEGIECYVADGLTAQVQPFYSNAIGGVKLQVKESDVPDALEILQAGGYLKEEKSTEAGGFDKLVQHTSRLPFFKNLSVEVRLLLLVVVSVSVLTGIIYYALSPSTYELLTEERWCVDQVMHDGKAYTPSTPVQFMFEGFCPEQLELNTNGSVTLPGFNSAGAFGRWLLEGHSLTIWDTDTLDFIYNGVYVVDLSGKRLILKSGITTIYCHAEKTSLNRPF